MFTKSAAISILFLVDMTDENSNAFDNPSKGLIARVLLITTTVQALATMNVVAPAAIAPELARAHGVAASMIGIQIGVVYLGAMLTSGWAGVVLARYGPLRTSQLALALSGVGVGLMALPWLISTLAGSVIIGLGYGLTNPPAAQMLMRVTRPASRNLMFSLKQTGVPIGGVAAGLLAPVVAVEVGWQWSLGSAALVTLAFAVVIQVFRRSWDTERRADQPLRANPFAELGVMWSDRRLRLLAFSAFCFSAMQLCVSSFTVTMLVEDIEFGLIEAGVVLAVVQVAGAIGRLVWGGLADKLNDGNGVLLMVGAVNVLAALATVLLEPGAPDIWIYGVLTVFGFAAVGWNGVFMAEIARLAPSGAIGAATGAVLFVTFAGILVGPPIFTGLQALTGAYTSSFGWFALVPAFGFLFILAYRR